MIAWSDICPVLVQVFTSIATDQVAVPWKAEWADRHRDYVHPEQELALVLKVTSCVNIGEDEDRYGFDKTPVEGEDEEDWPEDLYLNQVGLRRFIVNVQAEVTEDTDSKFAIATLERVRTRIRRPDVLDALEDVNVALIEAGTTQNISAAFDKRIWSIASLDVTFCAAVNDDGLTNGSGPVGWIERVVISTNIRGSLTQITNEEIPPAS